MAVIKTDSESSATDSEIESKLDTSLIPKQKYIRLRYMDTFVSPAHALFIFT